MPLTPAWARIEQSGRLPVRLESAIRYLASPVAPTKWARSLAFAAAPGLCSLKPDSRN